MGVCETCNSTKKENFQDSFSYKDNKGRNYFCAPINSSENTSIYRYDSFCEPQTSFCNDNNKPELYNYIKSKSKNSLSHYSSLDDEVEVIQNGEFIQKYLLNVSENDSENSSK